MNKAVRALTAIAIVAVQTVASTSWSAIPRGSRSFDFGMFKPAAIDFSRGLYVAFIRPVESMRTTRSEDVSRIIPSNMAPTNDGGLVATQILDHSLSNWFNSDAVRNSDIGRRAHEVEKKLEGDVSFGGQEPKSIKHSVRFAMRAAQTRAEIEYTGLTTAQVSYSFLQEKTNIEVREPVKPLNTQLVYSHTTSKADRTQMVSFRWDW